MNSTQQIAEAFEDYHAGRFGGATPARIEAEERALAEREAGG
jgi:hypothetical protein